MLPKNLKYQTKADPSQARAYTSCIQPQNNGSFSVNGQTITINIPTGRNLVLNGAESYCHCDVSVTNGATANDYIRWAGAGVQSLIQRVRVYWSGVLISDIDNYNLLAAKLIALQSSMSSVTGKQSILSGMAPILFTNVCMDGAAYTQYDYVQGATAPMIVGDRFNALGLQVAANASVSDKFAFPLIDAILGTLSDKYAPLFRMSGSNIRLELQLVSDPVKAFITKQSLASCTISNFEYVASFIELSDSALQIVESSLGGGDLMYCVPAYRNFVDTKTIAENSTTTVNVAIPAKFSSLKAIMVFPRDRADGAATYDSLGTYHYGLSSYQFRLGGEVVPSKPPSSYPEHFMELTKCVDTISNLYHSPMINKGTYASSYYNAANDETRYTLGSNTFCGCYGVGLDCEIYANADKDSLFSGLNSQNMDIYLQSTHVVGSGALNGRTTVRFDTFALFDAVLVCRQDGMVEIRT